MNRRNLLLATLATTPMLRGARSAFAQATPAPESPTVFVRQDPAFGPFFSDPEGRTLYLFTKDTTEGQSTCTGDCLAAWPAFTAGGALALPADVPGELTSFTRDDGSEQVAYNGIPLYYYAADVEPGDAYGQGVGGVWFVVAPGEEFGAAPMMQATPAPAAATPAAAGSVDVTLTEFSVMASTTTFKVGEAYTFAVKNIGQYTHEFYIEPAGAMGEPLEANGEEAEIEDIESGADASLEWTFTEVGNFQFACHIMDHYPKGMALTIHVVE